MAKYIGLVSQWHRRPVSEQEQ